MYRQIVKVYVRAGAHEGERTLSLRPPKEVPQIDWIRRGFAIDGNSIVTGITRATYVDWPDNPSGIRPLSAKTRRQLRLGDPVPWPGLDQSVLATVAADTLSEENTLSKALMEVEAWLVELLGTRGYDVEFA